MRSILLAFGLLLTGLLGPAAAGAGASTAGAPPQGEADPSGLPVAVRDLLRLLDDPGVRGWLEQQRANATAPATATAPPEAAGAPSAAASDQLAGRLEAVRAHLHSVAAAVPRLPAEIERASSLLLGEMKERGLIEILVLLVGFAALGYGVE